MLPWQTQADEFVDTDQYTEWMLYNNGHTRLHLCHSPYHIGADGRFVTTPHHPEPQKLRITITYSNGEEAVHVVTLTSWMLIGPFWKRGAGKFINIKVEAERNICHVQGRVEYRPRTAVNPDDHRHLLPVYME